jgi:hypothetical protein
MAAALKNQVLTFLHFGLNRIWDIQEIGLTVRLILLMSLKLSNKILTLILLICEPN